ncbi:MAG: hypothetical protein KKE73_14640 [Proteobacteria bacterium]|nr:hypothetical protein [Pseudomonadota bacterium]
MNRIIVGLMLALLLAPVGAARAENVGEALLQCVTLKWVAAETYPPQVKVEAWVFGKSVGTALLDEGNTSFEFAFEDGFVLATGKVSATFMPFEGKGQLRLDALETACDFSGAFPVKPRPLADFAYKARFDY